MTIRTAHTTTRRRPRPRHALARLPLPVVGARLVARRIARLIATW
jgi:hypothetical protein